MRLLLALVLSAGLLALPSAQPTANAKTKKSSSSSKKADKKTSSKSNKSKSKNSKDTAKKSSKSSKKDKRGKDRVATVKRRDNRSASSKRRGKNEDDDNAGRSRRASNTSNATASTRRVMESGDSSADDSDADVEEEAPVIRPANRIVADISTARVIQIQNALITKGFLAGPANGVYDQPTFNAMASFQSRNGWNPVGVPTADSLKALGVPKNSGRGFVAPTRVVDMTAPK